LEFDSTSFTHPISSNVSDPAEIEQLFDDISYAKGSSIIRMLQDWLNSNDPSASSVGPSGASYFQRGLKTYLTKFEYGNAQTSDLWSALETEGVDLGWMEHGFVTNLISGWTDQPG
jgi:aminopeptidase N